MTRPRSRIFALLALPALAAWAGIQGGLGYQDTPKIRGWHVHDGTRPQPTIVSPGREPGAAPSDAMILFDGKSLESWNGPKGEAKWKIAEGAMEVTRGGGKLTTKESFGDCQLHIEWRTPKEIKGKGQGRGNSGVFFLDQYEVQVLDSYGNETYPDGQAAAMYGQWPPRVNASRAPGEWQTYDAVFEVPRFDEEGKLVSPAYLTLFHNGVCIHNRQPYDGPSSHKRLASYRAPKTPGAVRGPVSLQDHGNPIQYRNIWIRSFKDYDAK